MRAVILQFPAESLSMAKNDEIGDLTNRVQSLEDRLKNVQIAIDALPPSKPTPWWASIVGPLVGALVASAAIVGTLWVRFDTKFDNTNSSISQLSNRLQKTEDAIKAISSQQSEQTQKLVHDLLASAASNAAADAPRLILAAKSLVEMLRNEKRTANPEFFQDGIDALDQIKSRKGFLPIAFGTRIAFAQFRSANEIPQWTGATIFPSETIEHVLTIPGHTVNHPLTGIDFKLETVTGNAIEIGSDRRLARQIVASNDRFDGGTQILDGIHWHDVDFIGTHIRYEGGELDLQNVRFINCEFDIPAKIAPSKRADQFVDYAALARADSTNALWRIGVFQQEPSPEN